MSEANAKPRRRWFQFSLPTLLIVVTLVAGLLVAWRAYTEPYRRQRETMVLIKKLGGYYKPNLADRVGSVDYSATTSSRTLSRFRWTARMFLMRTWHISKDSRISNHFG